MKYAQLIKETHVIRNTSHGRVIREQKLRINTDGYLKLKNRDRVWITVKDIGRTLVLKSDLMNERQTFKVE